MRFNIPPGELSLSGGGGPLSAITHRGGLRRGRIGFAIRDGECLVSTPQDFGFGMLELLDPAGAQRTHMGWDRRGDPSDAVGLKGVSWDTHPLKKKNPHIKYGDFINSKIICQQIKCRAPVRASVFEGCCKEQQLFGGPHCPPEMGWWQSNGKREVFSQFLAVLERGEEESASGWFLPPPLIMDRWKCGIIRK